MVPGPKFSTTTSPFLTRSSNIPRPRGSFRLSVTLFLLAFRKRKPQLSTPGRSESARRLGSPASGSTLMTSAPSQARVWVHEGPASYCVRSMIRMPSSAFAMTLLVERSDDALLPERALLRVREAELGENLARVLTQQWRRAVHHTRRLRQLHGNAQCLDRTRSRMREVHHHPTRQSVRIGQGLGVAVDRSSRPSLAVQLLEPVRPRVADRGLLDRLDQRGPILHASAAAFESGILEQIRPRDRAAQP